MVNVTIYGIHGSYGSWYLMIIPGSENPKEHSMASSWVCLMACSLGLKIGKHVQKYSHAGCQAIWHLTMRVIMVSPPLFCAAGIFWFATVKSPLDTTYTKHARLCQTETTLNTFVCSFHLLHSLHSAPSHANTSNSLPHQAGEPSLKSQQDLPRLVVVAQVPAVDPEFSPGSATRNPSSSIAAPQTLRDHWRRLPFAALKIEPERPGGGSPKSKCRLFLGWQLR